MSEPTDPRAKSTFNFTFSVSAEEDTTEAVALQGLRLGRLIVKRGFAFLEGLAAREAARAAAREAARAAAHDARGEEADDASPSSPQQPPRVVERYTPTDGNCTDRRDTREDWFATAKDRGQHDTHKRFAYLALYRFLHPELPIVPADFGTGTSPVPIPMAPLFPLEMGLAEACRRLGFVRLFDTAVEAGTSMEEVTTEMLSWLPDFYAACVAASTNEVEAVIERQAATKKRLGETDPAVAGILTENTRAEIAALYSIGAFDRYDLASCPDLLPLVLLPNTPHL